MGMEARKIGGLLLTVVSSLASGIVPIMLTHAPRWEVDGVVGVLLASTLAGVTLTFLPSRVGKSGSPRGIRDGDISRVGVNGVAVQGQGHIVTVFHGSPVDPNASPKRARVALDPVVTLEAIEKIYSDYTAIQARHLAKVYDGRLMRVAGSIEDARELDGGVSIELRRPERLGLVHCLFDAKNSASLEVLPKGYHVVVTGVLDLSLALVTLTDCELEVAVK